MTTTIPTNAFDVKVEENPTQSQLTELELGDTTWPKMTTSIPTNAFGVEVEKNPTQAQLTELGVTTWPKWEGGPDKFPYTFPATDTMYLLKGKVKVQVDGIEGSFEIGAGDLAAFPKGMKVIWETIESVEKYYREEK